MRSSLSWWEILIRQPFSPEDAVKISRFFCVDGYSNYILSEDPIDCDRPWQFWSKCKISFVTINEILRLRRPIYMSINKTTTWCKVCLEFKLLISQRIQVKGMLKSVTGSKVPEILRKNYCESWNITGVTGAVTVKTIWRGLNKRWLGKLDNVWNEKW